MKRIFPIVFLLGGLAGLCSAENPGSPERQNTLLYQDKPFSRETMLAPGSNSSGSGISFLDPGKFSMSQSYSTSMAYSGGESYSFGLYLNTLTYQLFKPLTFSIDLGIYTPFHSTTPAYTSGGDIEDMSSLVLPRIGLEYQPTKNTLISVQYFNVNDASRSYGPFGYLRSPFRR
ncbi:hypothetical protein ACFL5V_03625 [Fibrobacterota bacterium]